MRAPARWALAGIALSLPAVPLAAGANRWTPISVGGGTVLSIAAAPSEAGTYYAVISGVGIFKSIRSATAGGVAGLDLQNPWREADQGIDSLRGVVRVAVDPGDPQVAYACSGSAIWKTSDGGATWRQLGDAVAKELVIAPSASHTGISPAPPGMLYSIADPGWVRRSTNGGATWQPIIAGLRPNLLVSTLAVSPADASTLYVTGQADRFGGPLVFKTTDAGATWSEMSAGLPPGPQTGVPSPAGVALAIDPVSPSTLYLATYAAGIWKSSDGGAHWARSSNGLGPGRTLHALALDPAAPQTLYAGGLATVSSPPFDTAAAGAVWKSGDGGATWARLPWTPAAEVEALAVDARHPGCVAAGLLLFGVAQSCDGGATWSLIDAGLDPAVAVHQVLVDPFSPGTLYAAVNLIADRQAGAVEGASLGVLESADGGTTWTPIDQGLSEAPQGNTINRLLADPETAGTLYAAGNGLYKTSDAGATWQILDLPHLTTVRDVTLTPGSSNVLYAAGCGIFPTVNPVPIVVESVAASEDGGGHWRTVLSRTGSGLFGCQGVFASVAVDPANPSRVYAGGAGFWRSEDGGTTWTELDAGLPRDAMIGVLRTDPIQPLTLYATLLGPGAGIARTADGGRSWMVLGVANGLPARGQVSDLAINPVTAALYAATDQGVLVSADQGATWGALGQGHQGLVLALAVDAPNLGTIYAGTVGQGIATFSPFPGVCEETDRALCLLGARFRATLAWRLPGAGWRDAHARRLSDGTGTFWFTDPDNLEIAVKVLDGRAVNSMFWVFFATLSDVELDLALTDATDYLARTYRTRPGQLTALADVMAFGPTVLPPGAAGGRDASGAGAVGAAGKGGGASSGVGEGTALQLAMLAVPEQAPGSPPRLEEAAGLSTAAATPAAQADIGCLGSATVLCLGSGRFAVTIDWRAPFGISGSGHPLPLTAKTGAFWFFDPAAADVLVKVLDGRAVNGHFWVFLGGLSDVAYTVRVLDTSTGAIKTYRNRQGELASRADTTAF